MTKKRWTTERIADQTGRVAIVTGANSGIGYETAKALAAAGATVIVASRSEERGRRAVEEVERAAEGARAGLMLLDLADLASVGAFVDEFTARFDRVDLLINNAGVMDPPKRMETADGFELQMGTNHLGHFALTLPLLGRLIRTEGSRVVNISSTAQHVGKLDLEDLHWTVRPYRSMRAYGASKIANMLFTLELQRRLHEAGASTIATSAHPGWTATNLQRDSRMIRMLNPVFGMQPWQGALPILYAAVQPDVEPGGYYGPDGFGSWRGYPAPNRPAKQSADGDLARRLWAVSERLVGIETPDLSVG